MFGMGRMIISDLYTDSHLDQYLNGQIKAEGIVVEEPDVREKNTKLTVKLTNVEGNRVSERILISVPIYPEYKYGDKVSLSLVLKEPQLIESEDGRVFDYKGYLAKDQIFYEMKSATVEAVNKIEDAQIIKKQFNYITSKLYSFKLSFVKSLESVGSNIKDFLSHLIQKTLFNKS
jgi:hypothetical protein